MIGLPAIYSFQSSLNPTANELVFALDADVRGDFIGGFLLSPRSPSGGLGNPRHSHKTEIRVGGTVVFESYHQSRAVWNFVHWPWVYQFVSRWIYRLQPNGSPSVPEAGRTYTQVAPEYWNTYFPPQPQDDLENWYVDMPNVPPSPTPRDPSYIYNAPHLPVWFRLSRDAGQEIKISVQAMMEVPELGFELTDEEPITEQNQAFTGQIVGWLIRI